MKSIYTNKLKNWHFGCAKAPGFNDRKWVHIDNIDPLTIVESRELSRGPNANFLACLCIHKTILLFILLFFIASCSHRSVDDTGSRLSSINIIDRNGFSETISAKERLQKYDCVDFSKPQPYQKVLRVYGRDSLGNVRSCISTYYENGQPKQSLDAFNGRAFGQYREWHSNGSKKLEANVIGGTADLHIGVEKSWLFDGTSSAWDEDGHLLANIRYEKGELSFSTCYHKNGSIWKVSPYQKNEAEGTWKIFLENGELLQTIEYVQGQKHGPSLRYWDQNKLAAQECYGHNLLDAAEYYDPSGNKIAEIIDGCGYRILFSKEGVAEVQEYRRGVQNGLVKNFDRTGRLMRAYHVRNDLKHGEEIEYYSQLKQPITSPWIVEGTAGSPKLSVNWVEGKIQGIVKTWYENGHVESQREISNNKKHGILTAWYRNGSIMCIEEYDQNILVKGEYFRKGEKCPTSYVLQGKGVCTLYDGEGNFLRKINYQNGKPA